MTNALITRSHWHVLGAGAIGTLFAALLQAAGHSVALVLRPAPGQPRTVDITLERGDSSQQLTFAATEPGGQDRDEPGITHLLVTTKSYDVCEAVDGIAGMLSPDCQVLLLTNGMGLAERLHAAHPELDVYCGTTTEGAYRKKPRHIVHAGSGETHIGKHSAATPPLWFTHWQAAVDHSLWDIEIEAALWAKLAINCVINPLTALHRCKNGELATNPALAREVQQLSEEVQQVSYAAGFTNTAQTLPDTVAKVIQGTADNRSSMLQDVLQGRRTEIEDITGYLLQRANRYGIPAPHNQSLMERILDL